MEIFDLGSLLFAYVYICFILSLLVLYAVMGMINLVRHTTYALARVVLPRLRRRKS